MIKKDGEFLKRMLEKNAKSLPMLQQMVGSNYAARKVEVYILGRFSIRMFLGLQINN